jgi:hypothetical protein
VDTLTEALMAVDEGLNDPAAGGDRRRQVASELFYRPGGATARATEYLYEALALTPTAAVNAMREATCQPSA